jgi:hypothetical protein
MRQMFNETETTPEPCSKEKLQLRLKQLALSQSQLKLDENIKTKDYYIRQILALQKDDNEIQKNLNDQKTQKTEISNAIKKLDCLNENSNNYSSALCVFQIAELESVENLIASLDIKTAYYKNQITEMEQANTKSELETPNLQLVNTTLKKETENAQTAYNACLNKPKPFNLKLNLSCKEIKQKIKIVNKKRISINLESLDLKYQVNNLTILNINKNLYDKNVKIKKELIVKLHKLKPPIITSDPYFFAIYKKSKEDLAYLQIESKIIEAKLEILNLKEKTIPEKKIRLKNKFLKLIKKFKKC